MPPRLTALVASPLLLLLLVACAGDGGSDDSSGPLDAVTVSGELGEKPEVEFETPFEVTESASRVVTEGDGDDIAEGQQVEGQVLTLDATSGEELESSYEQGEPAAFPVDPEQINADLFEAVVGAQVGSRLLLAVPAQGEDASSILVVVDLLDARQPLDRAEGTAVPPVAGLPTVTLAEDGAPTITLPPDVPAPAQLVTQQLLTGTGPVVEAGQRITVHYTGVTWPGGEVFDSSWEAGSPATFGIGNGQVIPGWDKGLVGQPVGSQVLLVVPPIEGYGTEGQPEAGIEGTDTLVFVVDVLDAA